VKKAPQTIKKRKSGLPKDYDPSKPASASTSASASAPKRVTVTQADNGGFITTHEPPRKKDGGYEPDVQNVHGSVDDMQDFVGGLFSDDKQTSSEKRRKAAQSIMRGK
jgi:hypothetical protein